MAALTGDNRSDVNFLLKTFAAMRSQCDATFGVVVFVCCVASTDKRSAACNVDVEAQWHLAHGSALAQSTDALPTGNQHFGEIADPSVWPISAQVAKISSTSSIGPTVRLLTPGRQPKITSQRLL